MLPPREVCDRDVFVDLGSGKGRVVLDAARFYPFKRVIGVEFSPELNDIAARNISEFTRPLRCRHVELVTADVAEWAPPDDLTVVYLFNAVRGDAFTAAISHLTGLVDRRQRPLRLIYVNPKEHERLMRTGRAVLLPGPIGIRARVARLPSGWVRSYELRPRTDSR